MTKDLIKVLIAEYQKFVADIEFVRRDAAFAEGLNYVLVGLRHAGKSYLMYQRIAELLASGHKAEEILFFNFEDDRIDALDLADLDRIKTCYEEMYDHRPIFFLDEIQLVEGWEKFARRLADQKYRVYITGSNAKMLSREIATTLGGRFMIMEVYPYSFGEYLSAHDIDFAAKNVIYQRQHEIVKMEDRYFRHGGLPETAMMKSPRPWLSSLYNKIFFGDMVARHGIRNDFALRVLVRKLAENVKQPLSYTRMAHIISSTGRKISVDACIDYIGHMTQSWLLLPYENLYGKLQDKELNRKYYFVDNGLLSLFLLDPDTSLLENMVAVDLRRRFGEDCYFFSTPKMEVDFYVPDAGLAVQVAYSLDNPDTCLREAGNLTALSGVQDVKRRVIVTKNEERTAVANGMEIEIIPLWKWLLFG